MRLAIALAIVGLMLLMPALPSAVNTHAQENKLVVALDLGHGESDKYINYIMSNITFVDFILINGTINSTVLQNVDILILGQPTVSFSVDEMDAIYEWLMSGNKTLWVAGDSDYGSGNETQKIVNNLLEYIGAKLRVEYASVYDDYHNCGRFYRVLFKVEPDNVPELRTEIISENITKPILGHGPAPLIWVDENGTAHDIVNETFPGLVRIAWSYDSAYIGDNTLPPPLVYDPFLYGQGSGNHTFVFIAAEYWPDYNDIIVVSGESPYGDYEPIWSPEYYGVQLDGPQFITNMIKWFVTMITLGPATPSTTTNETTTTSPAQNTTTSPQETTTPPAETTTTTTTPPATTLPETTTSEQTTTTPTETTTSGAGGTTTSTAAGGAATSSESETTAAGGGGLNTPLIAGIVVIIIIIIAALLVIKK